MSKIKILSEHLANQIAAGEVIERPASVVKELLENSIDAGAGRVQVEIEGSGTRLIRVIDDGMGMDGDDVLLCLERHATSKLGEHPDKSSRLDSIRSLGFRGEAIPSIASVARMTITSRSENDELGTLVEVRYGKILKIHETGCNKGTTVDIRDLFGNVPARKKFLKSLRTELFHIEEAVKNYSLAYPGLGITYKVNGKTVLELPAEADTPEERIAKLYGRTGSSPLIPVGDDAGNASPEGNIQVEGSLLSPEHSFSSSSKLRLFVNGRAVKDRMLAHAVNEGLAGYLLKGRTASGVLFVSLPHDEVDVNVHPTKQEIRFRQSSTVHRKVVDAVRRAMDRFQEHSRDSIFGGGKKLFDSGPAPAAAGEYREKYSGNETMPWDRIPKEPEETGDTGADPLFPEKSESSTGYGHSNNTSVAEPAPAYQEEEPGIEIVPGSLNPIGQFMDLYLLCEARRGDSSFMVVIDQHAVHERILFEKLRKQYDSKQVASQNLLFPKMIELTPESAELLAQNRDQVERLGIIVEEFGGDNYIIKAVPSVISHLDPEEILSGTLSQFSGAGYNPDKGRKQSDATRLDDILSSMACKAAVKAGQNLTTPEIKELLKLMEESNAFTHCPHGRPVVRMFSAEEIKKWFHRT